MKTHFDTWLVVASSNHGRLIRLTGSGDRLKAEQVDEVREHWDEKEHHRPSPLGPNKASHSFTAPHHEREERLRRFARVLSDWVAKAIAEHGVEDMAVCASPRLMGALRQSWSDVHRGVVREIEADLTDLPAHRLAEHPRIQSFLHEPVPK